MARVAEIAPSPATGMAELCNSSFRLGEPCRDTSPQTAQAFPCSGRMMITLHAGTSAEDVGAFAVAQSWEKPNCTPQGSMRAPCGQSHATGRRGQPGSPLRYIPSAARPRPPLLQPGHGPGPRAGRVDLRHSPWSHLGKRPRLRSTPQPLPRVLPMPPPLPHDPRTPWCLLPPKCLERMQALACTGRPPPHAPQPHAPAAGVHLPAPAGLQCLRLRCPHAARPCPPPPVHPPVCHQDLNCLPLQLLPPSGAAGALMCSARWGSPWRAASGHRLSWGGTQGRHADWAGGRTPAVGRQPRAAGRPCCTPRSCARPAPPPTRPGYRAHTGISRPVTRYATSAQYFSKCAGAHLSHADAPDALLQAPETVAPRSPPSRAEPRVPTSTSRSGRHVYAHRSMHCAQCHCISA